MDLIRQLIVDLQNRIEKLEKGLIIKKITIPSDSTGYFVIKAVSSDPGSPAVNEMWFNTTTNQIKINKSGTIVAVTLS